MDHRGEPLHFFLRKRMERCIYASTIAVKQSHLKNKYPLPKIDDLYDQLRRDVMFSKINLRLDYHHDWIKEEEIR